MNCKICAIRWDEPHYHIEKAGDKTADDERGRSAPGIADSLIFLRR